MRTPVILHIFGVSPESAFARRLTRVFGDAVGVRCSRDQAAARAFDAWAWVHGIPVLRIELRPGEALIGPLALPGRAGCGFCAYARLAAAEAAARTMAGTEEPAIAGDAIAADLAAAVLVDELRDLSLEESRLLDHVLILNPRTGRSSRHRVIPLPRCPVCSAGSDRHTIAPCALPGAQSPPEELLAVLAGWVDPRIGIISRMEFEPSEMPVVVTASPPFIMDDDGSLRRLPLGWGKGLTISGAILSAVGETIERYAASLPDPTRIVCKRPADLDGEFLSPEECALYSDDQYARGGFPYARFDPEVCHPWVRGRWLGANAPVWIPAVFAFLSLALHREQHICQGTSNGLAAAADFEDAALRATFELVERDAFMTAWLSATPGRRLELDDAFQPELRQVLASIEELGAAVELYALQTSVCGAAVLALALGDGEHYPGATIGIGADLDPLSAVRQAILELGQTGPHLRRLMQSCTVAVPETPASVREMIDHAAYYFPCARAAAFGRLRSSAPPLALRDFALRSATRSLSTCAAILQSAAIRVALVDVTSRDVATGPFRVVRAVSPDLQPISYGYGFDRLPVARAQKLGLAADIPPIHPIW